MWPLPVGSASLQFQHRARTVPSAPHKKARNTRRTLGPAADFMSACKIHRGNVAPGARGGPVPHCESPTCPPREPVGQRIPFLLRPQFYCVGKPSRPPPPPSPVDTSRTRSDPQGVRMCKGREANRRRQRQTNQHHGLVPTPPPPRARTCTTAPDAFQRARHSEWAFAAFPFVRARPLAIGSRQAGMQDAGKMVWGMHAGSVEEDIQRPHPSVVPTLRRFSGILNFVHFPFFPFQTGSGQSTHIDDVHFSQRATFCRGKRVAPALGTLCWPVWK